MAKHQISAKVLGERLRSLRAKAMLTQAEVADRMGLTGRAPGRFIGHLENGRIGNPSVRTIALFLRACGARWHQVTDLLEFTEPVEIDTKPIKDTEFDFRDKQRMEWTVEKQVRKFETKLARPVRGKLLHPGKQAEMVRKLRNYRIVANIIEQDVSELLSRKPLATIEYPRFKMVARETVGMMWRAAKRSQKAEARRQNSGRGDFKLQNADQRLQNEEPEDESAKSAESAAENRGNGEGGSQKSEARSQNDEGECKMQITDYRLQNGEFAGKLAEKAEYWQMQKLDRELVREVQEVVVRRFGALRETNPELF